MNRRHFLSGMGALTCALLPTTSQATPFGRPRRLYAFRPPTGETFSGIIARDNRFDKSALEDFAWFARDEHVDQFHEYDIKVVNTLLRITEYLNHSDPIHVLSAYRTPKTNAGIRNAAANSLHMYGKALDIRHPGAGYKKTLNAALNLCSGGVGRYPGSRFIHIDCGPHRNW